jgi:hypothetical protein
MISDFLDPSFTISYEIKLNSQYYLIFETDYVFPSHDQPYRMEIVTLAFRSTGSTRGSRRIHSQFQLIKVSVKCNKNFEKETVKCKIM